MPCLFYFVYAGIIVHGSVLSLRLIYLPCIPNFPLIALRVTVHCMSKLLGHLDLKYFTFLLCLFFFPTKAIVANTMFFLVYD